MKNEKFNNCLEVENDTFKEVGFHTIDKIRLAVDDILVGLIGLYEPLSGDNEAIYTYSHDKKGYYDLRVTKSNFLAVIYTGDNLEVADKFEIISLIPVLDIMNKIVFKG